MFCSAHVRVKVIHTFIVKATYQAAYSVSSSYICAFTTLTESEMGRHRNRNRPNKNKKNEYQQDLPGNDSGTGRKPYALVTKTNEAFESFYKAQGIVPEDDWGKFMDILRKPLPSTFRITGFRSQAKELLHIIKSRFFDDQFNIEVDGRQIEPPRSLPWYPEEFAWQLDLDRKFIRQSESLKKLHAFLIEETESGNISRQEAVSMIPPLVLDIQSHHKVLDMCAAPGSKTAQLLEMLHSDDTKVVPEGCVVANDSDNKRCYMMTHQVKRLETPSFMIINQDASCMPNFKIPNEEGVMKSVKFDRILADVPCSGDGTMRKNVDAWAKWHVHTGMHLHNIQSRILSRGLEMLAIGGRIVYSTCSLNPIEDEAVISNMLRKSQGAVRMVDVSASLPGLQWVPGVSTWKVMSRDLDLFNAVEDVPDWLKSTMRPSVFPPTAEEAEAFQLNKCMRILPHLQNTGGFFIGVLEKTDELPWVKQVWVPAPEDTTEAKCTDGPDASEGSKQEITEGTATESTEGTAAEATEGTATESTEGTATESTEGTAAEATEGSATEATEGTATAATEKDSVTSNTEPGSKRPPEHRPDSPVQQRKRRRFGYKEDPFIFIKEDDPIWPPIKQFYGLENFPKEQLLVRCSEGKKRNIYFTSSIIKSLVTHNIERMKIINLGLKILSRSDSQYVSCPFRTVQDGVLVLFPHVTQRIVTLSKEDIITLLTTEMPFLSRFSKPCQDQLSTLTQGSVIFVFDPLTDDRPDSPKCRIVLCGWLGKTSCRSFIPVNDRGHYLRVCGTELRSKGAKQQMKDQLENNQDTAESVPMETGTDADNVAAAESEGHRSPSVEACAMEGDKSPSESLPSPTEGSTEVAACSESNEKTDECSSEQQEESGQMKNGSDSQSDKSTKPSDDATS